MEASQLARLWLTEIAAGFLNVVAGRGSLLTISAMMLFGIEGLSPTVPIEWRSSAIPRTRSVCRQRVQAVQRERLTTLPGEPVAKSRFTEVPPRAGHPAESFRSRQFDRSSHSHCKLFSDLPDDTPKSLKGL